MGIDVAGHNPSLVAGTTTTTPVLVATVGTTTTWTVGNGDDNSPVLTKQ